MPGETKLGHKEEALGKKGSQQEYIFLLPRKVCPWEGTEMKADFSFPRESFTFRDRREEGQVV